MSGSADATSDQAKYDPYKRRSALVLGTSLVLVLVVGLALVLAQKYGRKDNQGQRPAATPTTPTSITTSPPLPDPAAGSLSIFSKFVQTLTTPDTITDVATSPTSTTSDPQMAVATTPDTSVYRDEVGYIQQYGKSNGGYVPIGPTLLMSHFVNDMVYTQDGLNLIATSSDGTTRLYDLQADPPDRQGQVISNTDRLSTHSLALSSDGNYLAIGSAHNIEIWNLTTKNTKTTLTILPEEQDALEGVEFGLNGEVVIASIGPIVGVWNIKTERQVGDFLTRDRRDLTDVHTAAKGRIVAFSTLGDDGAAGNTRIWDLLTHNEYARLDSGFSGSDALSSSPDGRTLAFSKPQPGNSGRYQVRFYDIYSKRLLAQSGPVLDSNGADHRTVFTYPVGSELLVPDGKVLQVWRLR